MSKLQHFQWRLYQQTCFVWLGARLDQTEFVIVTAHNPKGRLHSRFANKVAHRRLIQRIRLMGYAYRELIGQSQDGKHQELSVALACSLPQGIKLANEFQQNAVYWVSADRLSLHGVRFAMAAVKMGSFKARCAMELD
ncbi:DUF3293 domain-containing protein [Motilimonas eburnea]|uniref:DUF3293 domain-containing protein n=1 Tax=Motilimonas eburnea TaxID=1737488 RepID=UPI001E386C63|nr:DUF3293 domain-containing protein [Motilimonas eburnea]MCE2570933.1 DUF3293 domain-containing protein [Motilimonas eburnea]